MMFVVRSLENHQPLHLNSARWIQPPDFFNSSSYLNLSQGGTLRWPPFPSTPKKQLKFREFFMLINNLAPHQKCTKTRIDMPKVTKKISSGSESFMCLYERWKRHFDYKFFFDDIIDDTAYKITNFYCWFHKYVQRGLWHHSRFSYILCTVNRLFKCQHWYNIRGLLFFADRLYSTRLLFSRCW